MKFSSARRLFVVLLAMFVTLGLSLSSVQASARHVDMAMSGGMDMAKHPDCPNCKGEDGAAKAKACGIVCVAPVLAVLPAPALAISGPRDSLAAMWTDFLHSRSIPPDPYPPRPTSIG
jgi:hypothetical protein